MSRWLRLPAALALSLSLSLPTLASAETKASVEQPVALDDDKLYSCAKGTKDVTISFKPETEAKELVTWMMGVSCKTIVYDSRFLAGRKVNIFAPKAMSPAEAYQVALAALTAAGLTIVPKGPNAYEVIEVMQAKAGAMPTLKGGIPASSVAFARYVYRPVYAQAATLRDAFGHVKSAAGDIQTIGTVLLLTDTQAHLSSMLSLAKLIDVPGGTDGVYTIPVKHADAVKLAQKLEGFLGITAAAATTTRPRAEPSGTAMAPEVAALPSKIMVDDRTNTLVLASGEAGYLRVKALVERLDIPLEVEGGAAFHVYRLSSAIAEELATTLNQAIQGAAQGQQKPQAGGAKPAAPPPPAAGDLGSQLEGPVRVIGDKPSNSLIVMSSGRDFLALRSVIRELDLPRRQVYIEAMILEVAVGNELQLGASAHGILPLGNEKVAVGSMQNGSVSTLDPKSIALSALPVAGLLGKAVQLFGQSIPSYGVLLQAVADTSNLNVLSAPSIIALDNEEAKYKVGVNVPYKKASFTGLGGGDTPTNALQTNFDRKDLLLQLVIKPHISTDDNLLLEVKHDAEELQGESVGGPIWSTRSIETRVVVRDQQTVVIGGLLQERETHTVRKVPLLGDIPLLGHLFKHTVKGKRKTNLVIMLTPYIVKDQLELQAIRERKLRENEEFTRSFRSLASMPYQPRIDYGRKRGLIEDINRTVTDIEADALARAQLRQPPSVLPGVVETPAPNP